MRLREISTRAVARLGLASLVFVAVIVVAPMAASAAPTATISSPTSGGPYSVGQSVPTSFSCADSDAGDSLISCNDNNGTNSAAGASGLLNTSTPGGPFTYTVTATSAMGVTSNASLSYTVIMNSQTIQITSPAPATATVGGATYTPAATGGASGNAVVFSIDASSTGGACSLGAGVVSFTGAGTCLVDANQAGNANYSAAPQIQQSTTVSAAAKSNQTITITNPAPATATVGGATYTPAATGGASGNAVVFSIGAASTAGACSIGAGVVSFTGVGTCLVNANQAGNASYNAAPLVQQLVTVSNAAAGGGGTSSTGTTLDQTSPTSGVATSGNSGTFTGGPITVSNATGAVSFVTTSSSTALSVSSQGAITTTGILLAGSYSVSGTDIDTKLDTGTWTFTLTVTTPKTVTFVANSGHGSMTPESKAAPTALTPNTFTRPTHIFHRWNTAANGSGTSYANGAVFPFTTSTTLYAQWTTSKKIAPTRKVIFDANGGSGSMSPESKNVLASLESLKFQRTGFSFVHWSTAANGSGATYANDAAYKFTKSATLFAQWKAKAAATFTVTFNANRGSGSMSPETKKATAALTTNRFKRHGFKFDRWNTTANGSGANYADGAAYHFNASTILFAQWTVVKPTVVLPAVHAVVALSPFAAKSTTLSTSLEAKIAALAREIKANRDKKIALVGYSGDLTTANITNEADLAASLKLSMQRAVVVESYLKQQLALLGVTGYTITVVGSGAAIPVSSITTAAGQAQNRKVVATIT